MSKKVKICLFIVTAFIFIVSFLFVVNFSNNNNEPFVTALNYLNETYNSGFEKGDGDYDEFSFVKYITYDAEPKPSDDGDMIFYSEKYRTTFTVSLNDEIDDKEKKRFDTSSYDHMLIYDETFDYFKNIFNSYCNDYLLYLSFNYSTVLDPNLDYKEVMKSGKVPYSFTFVTKEKLSKTIQNNIVNALTKENIDGFIDFYKADDYNDCKYIHNAGRFRNSKYEYREKYSYFYIN